jgi:hypothetical protein
MTMVIKTLPYYYYYKGSSAVGAAARVSVTERVSCWTRRVVAHLNPSPVSLISRIHLLREHFSSLSGFESFDFSVLISGAGVKSEHRL